MNFFKSCIGSFVQLPNGSLFFLDFETTLAFLSRVFCYAGTVFILILFLKKTSFVFERVFFEDITRVFFS